MRIQVLFFFSFQKKCIKSNWQHYYNNSVEKYILSFYRLQIRIYFYQTKSFSIILTKYIPDENINKEIVLNKTVV